MNLVHKLVAFLAGKKTHLVAFAIGVLNVAVAVNWVSPAHLVQLNLVLGALGLSALRAGVSKSNSVG